MPRRVAIALVAGALGLATTAGAGWAARHPRPPRPIPGARACIAADRAWARSLRRRRGRPLRPLVHTVPDDSDVDDLNDNQAAAAQALVEAAATAPNGILTPLVGTDWDVVDVQALPGGIDPRTGQAVVWGAEVEIALGAQRRVNAAVPASVPTPSRPARVRRRFSAWRSLGYVPYCVQFSTRQLFDLTVDVDMRSGAGRIVDVFPGPATDDVLLPRLPGQGSLPPGS